MLDDATINGKDNSRFNFLTLDSTYSFTSISVLNLEKLFIVSVKILEINEHDFFVYSISFFVLVILNCSNSLDISTNFEDLNSFFNLLIPFKLI